MINNAPQPIHLAGEGMQQPMHPQPAPQPMRATRPQQPAPPQQIEHQPAPRPVTHPALAQAAIPRPSFTHTPASANSTESAVGVSPPMITHHAAPARPIQPHQAPVARTLDFANIEAASHPNAGQSSGGDMGGGGGMPRLGKPKGTGGPAEGGAGGGAEAGGAAEEAGSAIEGIGEIAAAAAL